MTQGLPSLIVYQSPSFPFLVYPVLNYKDSFTWGGGNIQEKNEFQTIQLMSLTNQSSLMEKR